MKFQKPMLFFNIVILFFISLALMVLVLFVKIEKMIGVFCVSLILIFLIFILYILNVGISVSEKTIEYKQKISHDEDGLVLHSYYNSLQIKWDTIEAIFLFKLLIRDGVYHNNEYRIILNKEPVKIYKRKSYIDKIFSFPKEKYPMVKIDDHYNVDFAKFLPLVEKYLLKKKSDISLEQKFSDTIEKVFDRENQIANQRLQEYREDAKK